MRGRLFFSTGELRVTEQVTLHLFAATEGDVPAHDGGAQVRFVRAATHPMAQATATQLRSFTGEAGGEWVGFVERSACGDGTLAGLAAEVAALLGRNPAGDVVLLATGTGLTTWAPADRSTRAKQAASLAAKGPASLEGELPTPLLLLVQPPEHTAAIVVRRKALESSPALRDVSFPLWDWLIRLSAGGHPIIRAETSPLAGGLPADAALLPSLAPRAPGKDRGWLREHIRAYERSALRPEVGHCPERAALLAGLYQVHDFLDESHSCSQQIEGEGRDQSGDYWHGIMHRREPDASNAKYWFRRLGRHPVFEALAVEAEGILSGCAAPDAAKWSRRLAGSKGWDPAAFIDLCENCRESGEPELEGAARRIQWAEMLLLLRHTHRDTLTLTGGGLE